VARIAVGRVVAIRVPSAMIRSAGTPVISATFSGGYCSIRSRNSGHPTVCAARKAWSAAPSPTITLSSPSASAASVPGMGARCSSACRAVRVRTGSMATRWAPEAWMNFQMWWPLVSGLVPHRMISFARR
jgi:hypothetical protein